MSTFREKTFRNGSAKATSVNAIVKPVHEYVQPVEPGPRRSIIVQAIPIYGQLFATPSSATATRLKEQSRFGTPTNESFSEPQSTVPMKRSDTTSLKRPIGSNAPRASEQIPKPLSTSTRKQRQLPQVNVSRPSNRRQTPSPLRNRFDYPLTKREIEQLKLKLVKGERDQETHELLKKLLTQSEQVGVKVLQQLQNIALKPTATIPSPIAQKIKEAQSDLYELDSVYPTLSSEEQKKMLVKLRHAYGAPKKSNPVHMKKKIREAIKDLEDKQKKQKTKLKSSA